MGLKQRLEKRKSGDRGQKGAEGEGGREEDTMKAGKNIGRDPRKIKQ